MDELVEKVREALAAEYPGAPNGRVRDLPDRRAIRWYTTIGLVDRPIGMRGRTALYGPRHLQQLVAIKRLQAEGRSLAQIQAEFSWLSPDGLGEVSQVNEALLADSGELGPELSGRHARFWADAPVLSASEPVFPAPPAQAAPALQSAPAAPALQPASAAPPFPSASAAPPLPSASRREVTAVPLDGGVILLVPQTVNDRDRADIAAAAAPLIALLAARGLTDGSSS
jgi:DNA-binding transcriptional MerR regulator